MIQEINLADIEVNRTTPVTPEDVAAMAESIKVDGLQRPLIVDQWGLLIDGLIRLRALEVLGVHKVEVEVARDIDEAVMLLKTLQFNPHKLHVRRRRDFGESLDQLLADRKRENLAIRSKGILKGAQTRELVSGVLGYPWHRIKRVYRWLEQDPHDQSRLDIIKALDVGRITPHQVYKQLSQLGAPSIEQMAVAGPIPMGRRRRLAGGDITVAKEQRHLLQELNRQLSGAVKGAAKLAIPINIPVDELGQYVTELTKNRAALSSFIRSLQREVNGQ